MDGSRGLRWPGSLFAVVLSTACFDAAVPPGTQIECAGDEDCPEGYLCRSKLGLCVAREAMDETPPGLDGVAQITPEVAKAGVAVQIRFKVSEALNADPTVLVDTGVQLAPCAVDEAGTDRAQRSFAYSYPVDGTERPGPRLVTANLLDLSGNETRGVALGSVLLDFAAPAFAAPAERSQEVAKETDAVTVRLRFSEDVVGEPVVAMTPVEGGASVAWELLSAAADAPHRDFTYGYTAALTEAEGAWTLTARASDAAGNESGPLEAGALTLDFTTPSVQSVVTDPPLARPGDLVQVTVTLSEAPASVPTLAGTSAVRSLDFDLIRSAGEILVFRRFVQGAEDGVYTLALAGVADAAANVLAPATLGSVEIDGVPPKLASYSQSGTRLNGTDTLEVLIAADEPLREAPVLRLGGQFLVQDAAAGTSPYRYTLVLAGTGLVGSQTVDVWWADRAGNTTSLQPGSLEVDAVPPSVLDIVFNPPVARLGQTAYATVTTSEPLASPPALSWAQPSGAPGFAYALYSGLAYTYSLPITAATQPGTYRLSSVSMVDQAGNAANVDVAGLVGVAVDFSVDNQPPTISQLATDAPRYSLQPGHDVATVTLQVSEALAPPGGLEVRVGDALASCVPAAPGYQCTYAVQGTEPGVALVKVAATDAAGNVGFDSTSVEFDFAPPTLAAVSVVPAVARLGSEIQVFLTASEPLTGSAMLLSSAGLDDGAGGLQTSFPLGPDGATLNYRLRHLVTTADADGAVEFTVSLEDVAGNRSAGLAVGSSTIDKVLPALRDVVVTPGFAKSGTLVEATFEVTKPLEAPPVVTLAGKQMTRDVGVVAPSYRYTHLAQEGDGEGLKTALLVGTDLAGNNLVENLGSTTFDFTPPGVASAGVVYLPDASNPLGQITAAKAGTLVSVTVLANEKLSTGGPPSLTATGGTTTLTFCVVGLTCAGDVRPSSFSAQGATFEAVVPPGASDGAYAPTVTWSDLAGNDGTPTFAVPAILVKTSTPTLLVDQAGVTFVRSPWGNAATEDLGAYAIPSGSYFGLEPSEPLTNAPTLAPSVFAFPTTAPVNVRVWADSAMTTPLGTLAPGADGGWPRQRLANVDTATAWVTGLDEAGNESAPVRIASAEWVATPNPSSLGTNPHRFEATGDVKEMRDQGGVLSATSVGGADGAAALAAAEESWIERTSTGEKPPARWGHAMAFDEARGRIVMAGGTSTFGTLQDVWEWDGRRWLDRTPVGTGPGSRFYHAMAYDSLRGRVVLFGGQYANQDLWEWDGTSWEKRTPSGAKPGFRISSAMAYDVSRHRIVLFGGDNGNCLQDVWEWDGWTWEDRTPTGTKPTARKEHSMAYDAARGRVVLFGGRVGFGPQLQDLWEWDGTAWVDRTPAGTKPSTRSGAAMAYDAGRARVVLTAGFNSNTPLRDVWEWDGTSWVDRTPAGTKPLGRGYPGLAYDSVARRIVLFGGSQMSSADTYQDLWEWDGTTWVEKTPTAVGPSARMGHVMAYDPGRKRVVMYGGDYNLSGSPQDVWEWDGNRWLDRTPAAGLKPGPREAATMAYDSGRGRIVMFGGYNAGIYKQDLWEWDGTSWVDRTPAGTKPSARYHHAMAYDSARGRLVVHGGFAATGYQGDLWEWDGVAWTEKTPTGGKPATRAYHAMAYDPARARVVLFGGVDPSVGYFQDVWEWDGTTWADVTPTGTKPGTRTHLALVYDADRGQVVMYSGGDQELWEWDGTRWANRTPLGTKPPVRGSPGMAFDSDRHRLFVFGGNSGVALKDAWERASEPARQPALQFTAEALSGSFDASQIQGLRVRAHCGGTFFPYGATDAGTTLFGWADGRWQAMGTDAVGLNASQPWLPVPNGALIDWVAPSAALAQQYYLSRDGRLTFQCRPSGTSGAGVEEARVGLDYLEVRVRYLTD